MGTNLFARCLLVSLAAVVQEAASSPTPLRPWAENSWYWSYHGEPVLLLGGSDDDNLFQWPEPELTAQLDRLAAAGGNVIRNTMSDRKDRGFEVYPFAQREDGRYDLDAWNEEYWARFERLLRETARRRIFVQIEIWDRFDYSDQRSDRWQIHPYNPGNNVNYTYESSGFARRYPNHPGQNRQPFFFTTPKQRNNQVVLPYQQRFVDKVLEHALGYEHVLYCIDNETSGEEAWGRYWAEHIKQRAKPRGKTVFVTEMWDDWNLRGPSHKRTFDHPERYGFVDVSQNNHNKGQEHWDNFCSVRTYLAKQPRPMNTTKTYGATGNAFGHTDQDAIERFWRHLLAGAASIRFHRPDSGLGLNDKAVACIQAARGLESRVPLWSVQPANDLLSERKPNEAYLAADPGRAYAVYFPAGGEVGIDLSGAEGLFGVHWFDIDTGQAGPLDHLPSGGIVALAPPGKGNWAAAIIATSPVEAGTGAGGGELRRVREEGKVYPSQKECHMEPIRMAFIGGGRRATYLYARILEGLHGEVTLVGAWSRSSASAQRLGEATGVPWFTDLEKMKADTGAEAGIVNVAYGANGQAGLQAVEAGYHILAETPIAHDLAEADSIIRVAEERGLKVEVAEQFHRRPLEQIKLALIRSGVFGEVYSAFNDFAGHGYHGVSVLRSYLGFDRRPLRAVGSVHTYPLAPHWSKISGERGPREETQEHGMVEFEGDRVGLYHWTSIGYDSAARWWRGSRFLAERGMGVSYGRYEQPEVELTLIGPDGEDLHPITVHRETERCDGGALLRVAAYTGLPDCPMVEWKNPFAGRPEGRNPQWHDDEIAVAGCIKSLVDAIRSGDAPSYGARQARMDQQITLAIQRSGAEGGRPMAL